MRYSILQTLPFLFCCVVGTATDVLANYDDLKLGALNTPPGTYKYLNYQAWVLPAGALSGEPVHVGGVATKSPPNVLYTGVDTQVEQMATPSFTVAAPYSTFGLYDFYFGCATRTAEPAANAALQCTLTVSGFAPKTNQEVAVASFTFTPPVSPVAPVPMIHAVLPSGFRRGLGNVTVIMDNKLAVVALDDLHYGLSK